MSTVEEILLKGIRLQGEGNIPGAVAAFNEVLNRESGNPAALYSLTVIALNRGNLSEALSYAERCVTMNFPFALSWYVFAAALNANGRKLEAFGCTSRALELDPAHVDSLILRGNVLVELDQKTAALGVFDRVLQLDPKNQTAQKTRLFLMGTPSAVNPQAEALSAQGIALQNQGDIAAAKAAFEQALLLQADHFASRYSLAVISLNTGFPQQGLEHAEYCVSGHSYSPMSWYIRGCARKQNRLFLDSLSDFDRALALLPEYKEALSEKGLVYAELNDYIQSLIQFNEVLRIDPVHKLAMSNAAMVLTILKKNKEAAEFYERLYSIDSDYEYVLGSLEYSRLHCCDWTDFEKNREIIAKGVREGKRSCRPLAYLALGDSAAEQLICTRVFMEQSYPPSAKPVWNGEKFNHSKIRLGYLSPDLREHPVGHLMAGVFERHDKSQFDVYSFSLGVNDASSLRHRFEAASTHFFDVRGEAASSIADLIRKHEIDVLIDLAGPTADARPDVLALKPAPVQVGYLGYAGTTAAPYMDYIIADETVIPVEQQQHYTEKVLYLPGCYLPTDPEVKISERMPTRAEYQLPETGFIFCSFNHDYKINPPVFDVWMSVLKRVEGSVLWLMRLNDTAEANLRKEALQRGVDPSRLIFAGRVPAISDHLARYRLAGLFLDTTPYNAHSTATDVLRAGLPVLTLEGKAFQSRVATSILRAIGMPELVVSNLSEYEEFAVRIGSVPSDAKALRDRLAVQIQNSTEFNPDLKTRNLERLYKAAYGRE